MSFLAIDLRNQGWSVTSHFHFAWQSKSIFGTDADKKLDLSEYIEYWRRVLGEGYIRKYKKNEFDVLLMRMRNANMMIMILPRSMSISEHTNIKVLSHAPESSIGSAILTRG